MRIDKEKIEFNNALKFLQFLDPIKDEWQQYYFRGQPNASLTLMPSVWRDRNNFPFRDFIKKQPANIKKVIADKIDQQFSIDDHELEQETIISWILRIKYENY